MLRSSISDNHHLLTHSTSIARNDPSLMLLSPQPLMSKRNRINDSDSENSREISKNSFSKRLALVFEKQRKLSSVQIAPYSPSPKPSSSFEKEDLLFSPSSPSSPPKQPERKYGGDPDDNVDASHHSTSSMTSTGSVSSVSLLKNSIMPWKKNQEGRKTRKGRKKNKKEKSNEMTSSSVAAVVKFNKKVKIRKICRIADMPQEEFKNYYYSNQEMLELRNKLRVKIRVIKEEQQKREDRRNFLVTPSSTRCNDKISNDDSVQEFFGEDDDNYDESSGSESSDDDDDDDDDEIEICCAAYHDKTCDCHCINERNGFEDVNDDEELVTCLRGLEHEFPTGKHRRRKNKAIARDIVFEEQRYWRERKEYGLDERRLIEDPALAIAEAYRTETLLAAQHARNAGINDENIAKRIYDKDNIIIANDDDDDGLLKNINKHDSIGTDATYFSSYSSSSHSTSVCTASWYTERNNDNYITNKNNVVVVNRIPDEQ